VGKEKKADVERNIKTEVKRVKHDNMFIQKWQTKDREGA
jgi:hypothetical protein